MKTTATLLLAAMSAAFAGAPADAIPETPASPASPWEFRVELYGWLTGIDGTTGAGPLTADIDASFSDIFDQLEMAAALQFEARNGRWGVIADGFYCELGASGPTPGRFYDEVEVGMEQFIGELSIAYRYMDTDYSKGAFDYDVAQAGLYTGLNIRF